MSPRGEMDCVRPALTPRDCTGEHRPLRPEDMDHNALDGKILTRQTRNGGFARFTSRKERACMRFHTLPLVWNVLCKLWVPRRPNRQTMTEHTAHPRTTDSTDTVS